MRYLRACFPVALAALVAVACGNDHQPSGSLPRVGPSKAAAPAPSPGQGGGISGVVAETMNAGAYTYVLINDGAQKVWAAGPKVAVKVGDRVTLAPGAPMRNFESKTLKRTFELVYFVRQIQVSGAAGGAAAAPPGTPPGHPAIGGTKAQPSGMPPGHPPPGGGKAAPHGAGAHAAGAPAGGSAPAAVVVSPVKRVEGGLTVAEIFGQKATLGGKLVKVRGKVTKFNANILGMNWIHLQDGTGAAGTNDLTVTTAATAPVGGMVVVNGKVSLNRDYGSGYKYDLIIEGATVTVE